MPSVPPWGPSTCIWKGSLLATEPTKSRPLKSSHGDKNRSPLLRQSLWGRHLQTKLRPLRAASVPVLQLPRYVRLWEPCFQNISARSAFYTKFLRPILTPCHLLDSPHFLGQPLNIAATGLPNSPVTTLLLMVPPLFLFHKRSNKESRMVPLHGGLNFGRTSHSQSRPVPSYGL